MKEKISQYLIVLFFGSFVLLIINTFLESKFTDKEILNLISFKTYMILLLLNTLAINSRYGKSINNWLQGKN